MKHTSHKSILLRTLLAGAASLVLSSPVAYGQASAEKIQQLEAQMQQLQATQEALLAEIESLREGQAEGGASGPNLPSGLQVGAYGEHHFNFTEAPGGNQSDIHRIVLYLGYQFNDWISLTSETEIEHAFVDSGDGQLIVEQFFMDFNFTPALNLRMGRALHPAGIINRYHEPTTFYSVERPTFSSQILPSTYFIDGIGLWGTLSDWFSYETYLHAGLDGSDFSSGSGIRGGRLKERPGLEDWGWSSRIDIMPLVAADVQSDVQWRVGGSYSWVGAENADQGNTAAGTREGGVHIFAIDTDVRYGDFELRGEWAQLNITDADKIGGGVAETLTGWYIEGAYHFFPDAWKVGKFAESDLVPFVRYSQINTQDEMPAGVAPTLTDNRDIWTFGVAYFPIPNVVLKADYQVLDSDGGNLANKANFGFGYDF